MHFERYIRSLVPYLTCSLWPTRGRNVLNPFTGSKNTTMPTGRTIQSTHEPLTRNIGVGGGYQGKMQGAHLQMGLEAARWTLVGQDHVLQAVFKLAAHKIGMRLQGIVEVDLLHMLKHLRWRICCCVNSCLPCRLCDLHRAAARYCGLEGALRCSHTLGQGDCSSTAWHADTRNPEHSSSLHVVRSRRRFPTVRILVRMHTHRCENCAIVFVEGFSRILREATLSAWRKVPSRPSDCIIRETATSMRAKALKHHVL